MLVGYGPRVADGDALCLMPSHAVRRAGGCTGHKAWEFRLTRRGNRPCNVWWCPYPEWGWAWGTGGPLLPCRLTPRGSFTPTCAGSQAWGRSSP